MSSFIFPTQNFPKICFPPTVFHLAFFLPKPKSDFLLRFFSPKICFPLSKPSLFFSLSLHPHQPSSPAAAATRALWLSLSIERKPFLGRIRPAIHLLTTSMKGSALANATDRSPFSGVVLVGLIVVEDSFFAPRGTTSLETHATSTYY